MSEHFDNNPLNQPQSSSKLPAPSAPPSTLPPVTLTHPQDLDAADRTLEPRMDGPLGTTPSEHTRLGRYEIHGEIGRGGMGAVLRARDPVLGRELALKVLLTGGQENAEALRRFHEEAQIGGQLQHPGLVPVYELGRDATDRHYFAMKLVEGRTLADLLKERKTLSDNLSQFLQIFEQICQAIGYAHARGVLHRDLKPANVMVGAFGEVQVMDWGLAKVLSFRPDGIGASETEAIQVRTARTETGGLVSRDGSAMGTPSYMPPEQARGEVDRLDRRSDVFGLGAILCEILTGQPPFVARTLTDILIRAAMGDLTETFDRLDRCGGEAELVALARNCLAPDARERPADAGEVARKVAAYRVGVQERLRTAELDRARAEARAVEERRRRRAQLALAGSVLLLLSLAGAGGWWMRSQQLERRQEEERKQLEIERAVNQDLAEVAERRGQNRWDEAWAGLERAEGRLGQSGSEGLRERLVKARGDLEQVRTDREMTKRLEEAGVQRFGFRGLPLTDVAYRTAFVWYGLDPEKLDPEIAVAKIRASPIREELVSALYQWAMALQQRLPEAGPKARLALRADGDPWRQQIVEAALREDLPTLLTLLEQADSTKVSPATAFLVATCYEIVGKADKALPLLRGVSRRHPDDFLVNLVLGAYYLHVMKPAQPDEAVRFFTAAQALRPRNVLVCIGIGDALTKQFKGEEAILAFQDACRLNPDFDEVHVLLGFALFQNGKLSEAEVAYRKAVRLAPQNAHHHNFLGIVLREQGKLIASEGACREAIRLDPNLPRPHCSLGNALRLQGKFKASRDAFLRAVEVNNKLPPSNSRLPISDWLREAERLLEIDRRLPDVLAGKSKPANAGEQLEFAYVAGLKHQLVDAVRLYTEAFQREPDLALDPAKETRYNAARNAILSSMGEAPQTASISEPEPARLRGLALGWLRDELTSWRKYLDENKPVDRFLVVSKMRYWQTQLDLASVRDPNALARLPEAERAPWKKLWQDVNTLLKRASEPK